MKVTRIVHKNIYGDNLVNYLVERPDGSFLSFPEDPANAEYINIMQLVEAGELTIAPAEGEA